MNQILDKYEQELHDSIERGEWSPIENFKEELILLRNAALELDTVHLDIELEPRDLDSIKRKAKMIGVPYKSLIKSILHSYANVSNP